MLVDDGHMADSSRHEQLEGVAGLVVRVKGRELRRRALRRVKSGPPVPFDSGA